jgi:raffinose/stachyose/melibiose transport system substrate-binding protein
MDSRTRWFIVTLLIAAFVISACLPQAVPVDSGQQQQAAPETGEETAAESEEAAAPTEAAEEAEAQADEEAAPSGEKITLRFATIFDAAAMEQWQPVLDEYSSLNPNIEIAVEATAGSGAAIYPDVLKTAMASGAPPDMFFMWGGEIAGPFIDAGQVLDLKPYYDQYGWQDRFAPWTIERITRNGSLYGVPSKALGMGFWYRKDIFEAHDLEVPTTFAEQEALCETLKANDIYCVTVGGKFGWHTMRILDYFLETTCGPETHSKLNVLEESWDNQCVVDAYALFQKWIDNGWVVPDFLTVAPSDARFPWYSGDAALILEGVWYEGTLKNDEQDINNYDFYLPPTDQEPLRFSTFPEQWMISTDAAHPDEAAAFLDWISQPDVQKKYPEVFANSAIAGVNPDCGEWPLTCKWRDLITSAEDTYPPTDQAFVKELMDGFFEVQDGIVAGQFSPEEGAKLMQQRVEEWQARAQQ